MHLWFAPTSINLQSCIIYGIKTLDKSIETGCTVFLIVWSFHSNFYGCCTCAAKCNYTFSVSQNLFKSTRFDWIIHLATEALACFNKCKLFMIRWHCLLIVHTSICRNTAASSADTFSLQPRNQSFDWHDKLISDVMQLWTSAKQSNINPLL